MDPEPRVVTLVLVTPDGEVVGQLPPVNVETPWWQEAGPVVRAVRERDGLDVTILRLLEAARPAPPGGPITYLAEIHDRVDAAPWAGTIADHPLRQSWARPGGPAADLAWADGVLTDHGMRRIGAAEQVRSWNLSSLWRLPLADDVAWLKVVPPFFDHEGAILAWLAGRPVPRLLAHDGPRLLLAEIPGEDLYDAGDLQLHAMVSLLVEVQAAAIGTVDDLLRLGLPDWRAPALAGLIADAVARTADELAPDDRATLAGFVEDLPRRMAAVAACGIPDTLVHGDFHPGNVRGDEQRITLLDWGDSGVGHPLLDQPAFLDRAVTSDVAAIRAHWHRTWAQAVPGCRPELAATLLAPVAAARQAVVYRAFLDGIEPSEWPYHAGDPAIWLHRAAELVRAAGTDGATGGD